MNTFELGLAVLCSAAYRVGRERPNYAPIVPGAAPLPGDLGYENHPDSGFEAGAFEFGGKIVIAFAGTGPQVGDVIADVSLGSDVIDRIALPLHSVNAPMRMPPEVRRNVGRPLAKEAA